MMILGEEVMDQEKSNLFTGTSLKLLTWRIETMCKISRFHFKSILIILGVSLCIGIAILPCHLNAQSRYTIVGKVSDAETGEYLPGANLSLSGTSMGAASDRAGNYRIENVPTGVFTLIVSYMGYESVQKEVNATVGGRTITMNIGLNKETLDLGTVNIAGLRQGQTKALNQQMTAPNIKNVVSEEQMQRFPDVNSAEVLQRVPGVSVTRDQGEGRFVLVRGTDQRLNTTTINGEQIPSPQGDVRSVALDAIAADQLASIEVIKAITPDMDGSAIGGAVNLITKSALDYPGKVFNMTAGSGYNDMVGKGIYQGGFSYGDRFSENGLSGFMLSGSYQSSNRGSQNNELEWGSEDDVGDNEIPYALRNLETRNYKFVRDRLTLSGKFDFGLSENHKLFVNGLYTWYGDNESRHRLRIRPEKGDYNTATDISEGAIDAQLRDRIQNQTIYNLAAGGEHQFSKLKMDYRFSYSYAEEKEAHHLETSFELDEDADMILDLGDTDIPQWNVTNLDDGYEYNADNFVLDEFEKHDNITTDRDITAAINFKIPYSLGANQADLKFGGKARLKKKDRAENISVYGWEGDDDIYMSRFLDGPSDGDFLGGDYMMPPSPDPVSVWKFFQYNQNNLERELLREDTDGGTYDATEDVFAYYGMTTMNFGKLMVLGGVRHEFTNTEYTGHEVQVDEDGDYESTTEVTSANSYSHLLPMVHLRYKFTPRTNFRFAYTTGIARPHYEHLVPYKIINREDEEMENGNPDLVPTTSNNFDLLGEHYLKGIGVLGAGIFYKSMDNIIFTSLYDMPSGIYEDFLVEAPVQGDKATLFGFEITWQQQLTFLPGFLSNLGLYANYTYSTSTASVGDRTDVPMPGQSTNMANFALSYERGGFSGRVSVNYHGSYLDALGEDESHDIYYDNHLQYDISASQDIFQGLQVYVQAINLSNRPLRYYMGDTNRPTQREFYSWWVHAGVKFSVK
jgi:TonB-dependent receptor